MNGSGLSEVQAALVRSLSAVGALTSDAAQVDAMRVIHDAFETKVLAEQLLKVSVQHARSRGITWQQVGDALGISRQGAYQRFGSPTDPRTGSPMDKTPQVGAEARAFAIIEHVTLSRWDEACADFDEELASRLTAETLANNWALVVGSTGSYEGWGTPFTRRQGDYTVVDIPLQFEAGELTGRVAFDSAGRVAGLFFLNPGYAQSR